MKSMRRTCFFSQLQCFSLGCKANARVKLAKTGHGPHSSTLVVICVVRLLIVLFCVLFVCKCVLPPGDNATAVNKYIISYRIMYNFFNAKPGGKIFIYSALKIKCRKVNVQDTTSTN
jgi:hypothetical protein